MVKDKIEYMLYPVDDWFKITKTHISFHTNKYLLHTILVSNIEKFDQLFNEK